jgi:hypothetical protein
MRNAHFLSLFLVSVALAASTACEKKRSASGLAPASNWSANQPGANVAPPTTPPVAGNPHGAAPGGDPHAGVDMSGAPAAGGVDVTKMGLSSPDPTRAINPNNVLAGTLEVDGKLAAGIKIGTPVFLVAKTAGPDGAPMGPPLAVQKIELTGASMAFKLTEENAMVAGTQLTGDVVVSARYDQDSDALSKQPGDITGLVRAKVPSTTLKLVLNTVLP